MKVLKLVRSYMKDHTIGRLTNKETGEYLCMILERPDLENEQEISCIPEGTYHCKLVHSSLMERIFSEELDSGHPELAYTYEVQNVPMRTHILFHPANYPHELKGCLAPGDEYAPKIPMVTNSKTTYRILRDYIKDDEFQLMIMAV